MATSARLCDPRAGDQIPPPASKGCLRLVFRFLVSVSLGLLLFSSLGPLIDHHFAERIPHHSHAFIGQNESEHDHPFEASHVHYGMPSNAAADHGGTGNPFDATGILFLTPDDGLGQSIDSKAITTRSASGLFPDINSGLREFARLSEKIVPESWQTPPLKKPPQL